MTTSPIDLDDPADNGEPYRTSPASVRAAFVVQSLIADAKGKPISSPQGQRLLGAIRVFDAVNQTSSDMGDWVASEDSEDAVRSSIESVEWLLVADRTYADWLSASGTRAAPVSE